LISDSGHPQFCLQDQGEVGRRTIEGDSAVVDDLEESLDGPDDRRRYDRARLIVDVYFDGHDATGVASTKDISVGGFYMNTQATLPEGATLLVRIPLGDGRQIIANAEVVYSNPARGVGLRFQNLSDENRSLIESELGRG
jgi:PilZ domain